MVDHSKAIISSLFSPPPGTTAQPNESFIAYVQTFEEQPGAPRKARFLIIAAARDGRLKLHKAKQNGNGTFSIGKTWALEELRTVEVVKPLEFVLVINGKTYRYETETPTSLQAAFLVTVVRCWRRYMKGRGQPDLNLVGFSVDSPTPGRERESSSSTSTSRSQQRPPASAPPTHQQYPADSRGPPPTSASSNFPSSSSAGVPARSGPPPTSSARNPSTSQQPPTAHSRDQRHPSASSQYSMAEKAGPAAGPGAPSARKNSSGRPISPTRDLPISSSEQPSRKYSNGPSPMDPAGSAGAGGRHPSSGNVNPSGVAGRQGSQDASVTLATGLGIGMGRAQSRTGGPLADEPIAPKESGRIRDKRGAQPLSSTAQNGPPPVGAPLHTSPLSASAGPPPPAPVPGIVKTPILDDPLDDDTVLSNVEEMLEGFEWRGGSGGMSGRHARGGTGKADEIEKRLVGELKALEAASIHAIMESDDRVTGVIKHLDDALAELEKMDASIGVYKTQLSLMTDDIAHIEGQNRGLQVQTSNQRMLLSELDNLMSTINIPESDLTALSKESLENPDGIERLEKAAVSLYKALLSTRDTAVGDMAAASEHVGEYRTKAASFSKRTFDFLSIMFKFQVDQILNPKDGAKAKPGTLPSHAPMEDFLGRYCGLMLFVKEIDYARYQQICAAYFTAMSDLHRQEVQELMSFLRNQIKKTTEDELEANFSTKESPTLRQQSMRRAGTLVRSPLEGGKKENKDGKLTGSEAFGRALSQLTPHIIREQGFVSDFLHINPLDASITFADYMVLEAFFRRGATTYLAAQHSKLKDIRSGMESIFGWLEAELRDWIDGVLSRDSMQIVGILAALDRFILQGKEQGNEFLMRTLQKQYQKSTTALERACKEQIKSIEQTKLTLKKRKGVVPFVRVFPLFVSRVESQLEGADDLDVRNVINSNYERIIATIFESLQQMAKIEGESHAGEAKDQLNYNVILIENMHHIIAVFSKQRVATLVSFVAQAREAYNQNLDQYIKLVLRRPFNRVMDYFNGLEQLLRTTPPTEVSLHSAYTKSALRRAISDLRAKDLRKAVDALYKRVDKHFGDVSTTSPSAEHVLVLKTVWSACEEEMQRLTAAWKGLIEKCYPDDKVGLDFGRDEVHEYFVKAQTS